MAAPTWQATGSLASGTGNVTVNWPTHLTNDIGLLVVESANQTIALTTAHGFVQIPDSPQGAGTAGGTQATRLAVFWCRATSGSMASPVITDPGDHAIAYIITFRGCKTSGDPWNVTAGDALSAESTSFSIPGDTTTVADCLVTAIIATRADVDTGRASGWSNASLVSITERADLYTSVPGNGGGISVACGVKSAAGAYNATTGTLSTISVQGRISIALEPATTAHVLVAEAGSYAATGVAAGLLLGHVLAAASGAYSLSGTAADLEKGSAVIAEAGAYAVTGSEANLVYTPGSNHLIVADPGSYGVTGTAAGVLMGRKVAADTAAYAVTGTAATLLANHKVIADAGVYTQTGTAASLERGFVVAANAGSYVLTGQPAELVYEPNNAYIIGAAAGSYALTGTDASLLKGSRVAADSGAYVLTGSPVDFAIAELATGIAEHFLEVSMPAPHRISVPFQYKQGLSVMDTYTADNDTGTADSTLHTADDSPMGYR